MTGKVNFQQFCYAAFLYHTSYRCNDLKLSSYRCWMSRTIVLCANAVANICWKICNRGIITAFQWNLNHFGSFSECEILWKNVNQAVMVQISIVKSIHHQFHQLINCSHDWKSRDPIKVPPHVHLFKWTLLT